MTLAISIPTCEGLVICADRYSGSGFETPLSPHTPAEKILPLNTFTAMFATGGYQLIDPDTKDILFDAQSTVLQFAALKGLVLPISLDALCDSLASQLRKTFVTWGRKLSPEPEPLEIVLFQVEPLDKQRVASVRLELDKVGKSKYSLKKFKHAWKIGDEPLSKADWFGQRNTVDELLGREDVKSRADVQRFIFNPAPIASVNANEAAGFAKWLIDECSRNSSVVGQNTDAAVIRRDRGFEWLWKSA